MLHVENLDLNDMRALGAADAPSIPAANTATEVRSPTTTSTEVRSPTRTSTTTEVRSPTRTSTEATTTGNKTSTSTDGSYNTSTYNYGSSGFKTAAIAGAAVLVAFLLRRRSRFSR